MSELKKTKAMIGSKQFPVTFSYAHVFVPKAMNEQSTAKYSISLVISKDDTETLEKVEQAIKNAFENKKSLFPKIKWGKLPQSFWNPLRDGDEERPDDPTYENCMFINASSNRKPGLVDADREAIIDEDEFYSGCKGRATVNFFAFNTSGNKGVGAGLNNIQKLADGERLSGGASAEDDFADDEDDDLLG